MKKSLHNLYIDNPGNYIVSGSGGVGKTTQLLKMVRELLYGEELVEGKLCIPIYIRLKDLNVMDITPGILYKIVGQYFNNKVNEKCINEMFEGTEDEYRYLFLLDGYNEIKDYITNNGEGQTVTACLNNDIKKMCRYPNVNFIISMRNETLISGKEIFKDFNLIRIGGLTKDQIDAYLGHDVLQQESYLRDLLSMPMMLKVFGELYRQNPERASRLNTKYDLLYEWILLDTQSKVSEYEDIDDSLRKTVMGRVLPLFAFRVQSELIKDDLYSGSVEYDKIMDSVIADMNIHEIERKLLEKTISRISLMENNNAFVHDLIREFLAVYCLKNLSEYISLEEVQFTIKTIAEFMKGKKNSLAKKTNHVDFAELLFGAYQNEGLARMLNKYGASDSDSIALAYEFCYSLAGVMQDLSERKMAYTVGWKAIEMFLQIESGKSDFEKGEAYNYLYYCVNKYKEENSNIKDPFYLLERAKVLLEGIPENQHDKKYQKTYAAVLSNMGAHNVSVYCMNPDEAKKWHLKCLEYRRSRKLLSSLNDTYRTLMTDCFYAGLGGQKKEFKSAYYFYCAALRSITGYRKISEGTDGNVPVDLVVRAMGNEIFILKDNDTQESLEHEIVNELPYQIEYIYQGSTKGRRHSYDALSDLHKKIQDLLHWDKIDQYIILKNTLLYYLNMEL